MVIMIPMLFMEDENDDTAVDEGKRLEWGLETQWCPRHKALPGEAPSKGQNWTHGATFLAFPTISRKLPVFEFQSSLKNSCHRPSHRVNSSDV